MTCKHEKLRSVAVILHPEGDSLHRATWSIKCEACGVAFEFMGSEVSQEKTELSAWIREKFEGMVQ